MFISLQGQTDCFSLSGCSALNPQLHLTLGVSQSPLSLANVCQSFSPCTVMVGHMVGSKVTGGQWTYEGFFFNILSVFFRATWPELGPSLRAPFHWYPFTSRYFQKQSYMCNERKKWLVRVRRMSWYHCLEETWPTKGLLSGFGLSERNRGQFSPVLALPRAGRHKP